MGPSFSAAPLVFLPTPAWAELVAPDFLLLLRLGRKGLDFIELFQKVKSHCFTRHFHRKDLLAEVFNIHFTGLKGFSDVRSQRERLEAFLRWSHLHHLIRRIATVAWHPRRVVKCSV